jgi:hypothetical protein
VERVPVVRSRRYVHNIERRLGPKAIDSLIADYKAGMTAAELAQKYRACTSTVATLVRQAGVTKHHRMTPEEIELVIKLYQDGATAVQIAEQMDARPTAILKTLRRHGVKVRPRGRPKRSSDQA